MTIAYEAQLYFVYMPFHTVKRLYDKSPISLRKKIIAYIKKSNFSINDLKHLHVMITCTETSTEDWEVNRYLEARMRVKT